MRTGNTDSETEQQALKLSIETYPGLSGEQLREAQLNLEGYFELAFRIHQRIESGL